MKPIAKNRTDTDDKSTSIALKLGLRLMKGEQSKRLSKENLRVFLWSNEVLNKHPTFNYI